MRFSYILFFAILTNALTFGQSIQVNPAASPESSMDAFTLTKDVLISGGGCSEISNFSFKENNAQKYPSANRSWGYFTKGNSAFPFEDGIVLTTGYAKKAEGPSAGIVSDGGNGWTGDPDANVLAGRGTVNATVFEFDFVPYNDEISFNYIFASEEYPDWVCGLYNDVFGFIISGPGITADPGLTGKNIALLPNGDPVTINNVNNQGCGDDTYYVTGPFPYIQHGGRTTVLTASSPVVAGQTYHIKLLIADTEDAQYDSAVFLEAGSFDLGSNLMDIDGNVLGVEELVCGVDEFLLHANVLVPNPTYQWSYNGVEIPGATDSEYIATQTGKYSVHIQSADCESEAEVLLIFSDTPEVHPFEVSVCGLGGSYEFDLSDYESDISISPDIHFTYYTTAEGANNETLADLIPNFQNYTVPAGTTVVYVRVQNEKGCFDVAELTLIVIDQPITQAVIYPICDIDNDGEEIFDLESQRAELVIGNFQDFIFEFYTDAALTDLIPNPEAYTNLSNPQMIYVKIYSINDPQATCHVVETLTLQLNEMPVVQDFEDLRCAIGGSYTFDLTDYDQEISTTANSTFTYYTTQNGAENEVPADLIPNFQNYTVPAGTTVVYVRVETDQGCFEVAALTLIVIEEADTQAVIYPICDVGNDGEEIFDLESQRAELVIGNFQDFIFEFYTDAALTDLIPNPEAYTNLSNPQVIYVKIYSVLDPQATCHVVETLTLYVEEFPLLQDDTIEICDDLNEGSKRIDLRDNNIVLTPGFDLDIRYYLGVGGPEILNPEDFEITDPITEIHVVVTKLNPLHLACEESRILTIILHDAPDVSEDVAILESCVLTPTSTFYLPDANDDLVESTVGLTFSYHFSYQDALDNVNPLPFDYLSVSQLQIVYARFENALGCFDIGEIELSTVFQQQTIADVYQICDDPYQIYDGIESFDLTSMELTIEAALGGDDYELSYYTTLEDALSGNNEILNPTDYKNISNSQVIYVRAGIGPYHCAGIVDFTIEVLENPAMELIEELTFCANESTKKFLYKEGTFDTYTWYNSDGQVISNSTTVYFDQPGTYTLEVSMNDLPCPSRRDVEVKFSPTPVIDNIFVDGQTVTIHVSGGVSPYEYSYNNGVLWTPNHIMYNFPSGVYDMIARSKDGCVSDPKTFGVLGITNFISPNGDGKNDVWEIKGLEAYPNTNLKIFDRYGKMFVDRNLDSGFRWDGTYLGRTVPSGDYWYIIALEDGRKIMGHISVRASK